MIIRSGGCLLLCTLGIFAQGVGTITGTVVDLSGDPVAKAEIQATNPETKAVYNATTSAAGVYTFKQLPAGTYELSTRTPGFSRFVQRDVKVAAAETLHLNLHLQDAQLNTLGDGRAESAAVMSPHRVPQGPAPRLSGKPDFSGVWYGWRIVDPGTPKMTSWAEGLFKERVENHQKDQPFARCLPAARLDGFINFKLVQTRQLLVMLREGNLPRQIFMDGRSHPKDLYPTWEGHSTGRWEGDTLVVDTIGFNDQQWIDFAGHPQTEMMHLTERLRRPDLGHLEIQMIFDDPVAYVNPWVVKAVSDLAAGQELDEYICTENNKDPQHLVGK